MSTTPAYVIPDHSPPVNDKNLERAQAPQEIYVVLLAWGANDADIARVTQMHRRSVRRWRISDPGTTAATRLGELRNVVLALRQTGGITDKSALYWLRLPNRLLDNWAPLEVIACGGFRSVVDAAECFVNTERPFQTTLTADVCERLEALEAKHASDRSAADSDQPSDDGADSARSEDATLSIA